MKNVHTSVTEKKQNKYAIFMIINYFREKNFNSRIYLSYFKTLLFWKILLNNAAEKLFQSLFDLFKNENFPMSVF